MRWTDLLQLSTRMFKARTARTLLTILGMSIGIGAVLFLFSLGYGLQLALLKRITTPEALLTLDVKSENPQEKINKEIIEFIKKIDNVTKVVPVFELQATGYYKNMTTDFDVISSDPSYFQLSGMRITKGRSFEEKNEAVVSITGAQVLSDEADKIIGKKIKVKLISKKKKDIANNNQENTLDKKVSISETHEYKIVGIVKGDANYLYININSLNKIPIYSYNQVKVKCKNNHTMDLARKLIVQKGLSVSAISDLVDQAKKVFGILQIILILFGITSLIISAVGMFNTMSVTFLERTGEIGIMKSIGATNKNLYLIFIIESTIMGFLGGLGGLIIGISGGKLVNSVINLIATKMGGEEINIFYSPWWFILLIIIFATLIGFLTGIMPAKWASQADPLKALRYK